MTVNEILADEKLAGVKLKAVKKKKNNPIASKTTKLNSFIDVFGGMVGYTSPARRGKGQVIR